MRPPPFPATAPWSFSTPPDPRARRRGPARDLVRLVQQARKAADLAITDRITLRLQLPEGETGDGIRRHLGWVGEQVLAPAIDEVDGDTLGTTVTIDGAAVAFDLEVTPA